MKRPVLPLVLERFGTTSLLAFCAFVLIVLVSTPIGIWSGLHEGSHLDSVVRLLTFSSVSLPSFWVAYLLILLFSVKLNWLPSSRGQEANSLILPSITLSFSLIGQYIALIRKAISEQARSLHVENARLRGVKQSYLIQNHLLRNALPAPVTAMSLSFVYLLTGSIIVEEVFSWNGIGRLFIMSLRAYDLPVIQACMLLFGTLFLLNNLVTQCLVSWIDPHLRQTKEVPCQND